jgi:low affinity Fe/Cu permease
MPLVYGLAFGSIAWMLFTVGPFFDTSEALGLSENEGVIVSMFIIVGVVNGSLAQTTDRLGKALDRLVTKVYGLDD